MAHPDPDAFAARWLAAWNARDLDAILAHYTEDVVFASPVVRRVAGEPSGTLRGRDAFRAYVARALAAYPELRFSLRGVLRGADGLALRYEGVGGVEVVETMTLDAEGRVTRASVYYDAT